ncbi:MAG: septal ring lytic transglycosylase RlpA family protein [Scytonematopsis contorta HA4267-MV1]|jgi:rare lipoprotein A|nr:septal ring lytic transglycosylase RlpA family protein [Scytonematopsis contorta HA4267-MV1]
MLLIGLLSVTSWIGSFLPLNHLPPSVISNVTATKVSFSLGKLVSKQRPFFVFGIRHRQSWNVSLIPSSFIRTDWNSQLANKNEVKPQNPSLVTINQSQSKFCSLVQDQGKKTQSRPIASYSPAISFIEPNNSHSDFFSSKILRSLQNFFSFGNLAERNLNSSSSVVVVHRDDNNYEVWVRRRFVASVPTVEQANVMQSRLTKLLKSSSLNASQLKPALVDGIPALMAGNRFLFGVEKNVSDKFNRSSDLLAIEWANNLRKALQTPALSLVRAQQEMYGLQATSTKFSGVASWYGDYFHGRTTANGETFNENDLTVAHKSLPFNTFLQVTNLKNGNSVIVRVNDRGPYIPPRSLDLSKIAARCIDGENSGIVSYKAVIMKPGQPSFSSVATTKETPLLGIENLKPRRQMAIVTDF